MKNRRRDFAKRLMDIVVSAALLVLLSPVFVILSGLVVTSGRGPIIYRDRRVGRAGRAFSILKFRTMRPQPAGGGAITIKNDPRVTRIGRVLRSTKLDELPQLVNVLKGEMSLVGPRPESPRYVSLYTVRQQEVLAVRPGITGLAQIYFRSEEELLGGEDPEQFYVKVILPTKLSLDLEYVREHNVLVDLKIIALTALEVFGLIKLSSTQRFRHVQ